MSRIKINKTAVRFVGQKLNENANDIKSIKTRINDIVNDMSREEIKNKLSVSWLK